MADDTIEVEFQLTVDDLVAFNAFTCNKLANKCAVCKPIAGFIILNAFCGLLSFVFLKDRPEFFSLFVGIFLGIVAITFLYMYTNKRTLKSIYDHKSYKDICFFDRRTFRLLSDCIQELTSRSETLYKWSAVKGVDQDRNHIFIFLGPSLAYIVPKRAFADEAAFERFYQKCLEYFNAAKGEPAQEAAG
ncbi:MAG: YcxB family protein [Alphaproteobacteria bacterium]|nr:YcxB family protein [Alphaproteobacteria bacterium]MCB9974927.1 YcxB family protein [Rhodospirillales bacterium]